MLPQDKELSEIKGYVARLYAMVRSRSSGMNIALTEDQEASTQGMGETIEEINTNLQIANSFQQEEIHVTLNSIEKLLEKLLNIESEKFTKVDKWMGMGLGGSVYMSTLIFIIEESEKNYRCREAWNVPMWRGPGWVKRGFEPLLMLADKDTVFTIEKNKVLAIYEPTKELLTDFFHSEAYNQDGNYGIVVDPWKPNKRPRADAMNLATNAMKKK